MDANKPPNFGRGYPSRGERVGPAWAAGWRHLVGADNRWVSADDLAEVMTTAADITPVTARKLLYQARQAGHVEVRYRRRGTPVRRRADYRIPYRIPQP